MAISDIQLRLLEEFFQHSHFMSKGAVITDLDGTAVHEDNGVTIIHRDVEMGLKKIYEAGRPVVIGRGATFQNSTRPGPCCAAQTSHAFAS